MLAIGEAQERIKAALGAQVPVDLSTGLGDAVLDAFALAEPGDTVLLAPACSSFDMFPDYAERGRRFKVAVQELARLREDAGRGGAVG